MSRRIPFWIVGALLLLGGCEGGPVLRSSTLFTWMPPRPDVVLHIPSYTHSVQGAFSLLHYFFDRQGSAEVRRKIFQALKPQLGLDLLDQASLRNAGFDPNRPLLVARLRKGSLYAALPHLSAQKVRRFLTRHVGTIVLQQLEKSGARVLQGQGNGLLVRISAHHVHIFSGPGKPGPTQDKPPAWIHSEKKTQSTLALAWFAAGAARRLGLPWLQFLPFAFRARLATAPRRIDLELRALTAAGDPLLPLWTPLDALLSVKSASLLGWGPTGQGMLSFSAPSDLAFFQTVLRPNQVFDLLVKPRILNMARRNLSRMGKMFASLLGGEKAILERVLKGLEIDKYLLEPLTGRVGIALLKVGDLFLARQYVDPWESSQGVLLLEMKSAPAASRALPFLAKLVQRFNFSLDKEEKNGKTVYRLPLFGFGSLGAIYLTTADRLIMVSHKQETLFQLAGRSRRGVPSRTAGSLVASRCRAWPARYVALVSAIRIYRNITASYDSITRGNLANFEDMIQRISRISLALILRGRQPELVASALLPKKIQPIQAFEEQHKGLDWLLIGLGGFFAVLILVPLLRSIYRKLRYRS